MMRSPFGSKKRETGSLSLSLYPCFVVTILTKTKDGRTKQPKPTNKKKKRVDPTLVFHFLFFSHTDTVVPFTSVGVIEEQVSHPVLELKEGHGIDSLGFS